MSLGMLWTVARWELRLITRSPVFWLANLVATLAVINGVRQGLHNPHLVLHGLVEWLLPVVSLLLLPVLGSVRRRDQATGAFELIHTRPVSASAYVLGKFIAGWGAMVITWLVAIGVTLLVMLVMGARALAELPAILGWCALLTLPAYGVVVGLAVFLDAVTGRIAPLLVAGATLIFASIVDPMAVWPSLLLPTMVPQDPSPVFGYAPYAQALLLTRAWGLALILLLLALAIRLLARRTPVLMGSRSRVATALALLVAVGGGAISLPTLAQVPARAWWRERSQAWELEQVRVAAMDKVEAERRWRPIRLQEEDWAVELWVAPGAEAEGEALAQHLISLLPYFPAFQPLGGEPMRLFQGSYLMTSRPESGSLLVTSEPVRRAATAAGRRTLLRAMAEAHWAGLARLPEAPSLYPMPLGLLETWASGPAIYHQWLVLEQVSGNEAFEEELALWRAVPERDGHSQYFGGLRERGAIGNGLSLSRTQVALVLWEVGEEIGHQRLLTALEEAAGETPPVEFAVFPSRDSLSGWAYRFAPSQADYWALVEEQLGIALTQRPDWPQLHGFGSRATPLTLTWGR